jgi:hypothetical protein|tara:strand:- start:427 stop:789 length:363 start_codon:yes stop_codon:yes gene_type:complete
MNNKKLHTQLNKLQSSYDKKHSMMKKKQLEFETISDEVNRIKNTIDYLKGSESVKVHIIKNYGRDGKYVYGQVYYNINPQTSDKKPFRFMIGKMTENKSQSEWESLCREVFFNKVIKEHI